jgi:Lactoylglutathione lyase and related lyases
MQFKMIHQNFNVLNLNKSLDFYKTALGLTERRRNAASDGSFIIVYLSGFACDFELELTWLRDRAEPYNLGDEEFHLALRTDDYAQAHALHEKMGCICYENTAMGIYFIKDPDGYWLEILPNK